MSTPRADSKIMFLLFCWVKSNASLTFFGVQEYA
ncbi:hypothetical protein SBADM41S_05315 [Streptomyces badius]